MRDRRRGAVFRQSLHDFPCPVTLGEKNPSFGLHRFRQGLRFIPSDDDGFTLRGDKQRLLYKGRRRSHRFTILDNCSFEYDCILLKEPDTNIISLRMEGAGNFDFFRQPDFVENPFLKGSYAVYKKETLVGEGTGKLCHIHRPLIIDARGRRCWGTLAVVGNELHITIPEEWLSGAAYPVVVDPTVGTTSVGSQYKWDADPPEPFVQLLFEGQIPVNRFLVSDTINGLCTAYMYSYVDNWGDNGGRPVLYSDNGNSPLTRKSTNEGFADFTVKSSKPAGWRTASFSSNSSIASGSYIWFGVFTDYFWEPRFDYGSKCYVDFYNGITIPNSYPVYNVSWYENFKLSMYFTYTSAQNHVRTLTQGVKLTDSRKLTGAYKRSLTQTAKANSLLSRFETIIRKFELTVINTMGIDRIPAFFRYIAENIIVTMTKNENIDFSRKCNEIITVNSQITRIHEIIIKLYELLNENDTLNVTLLFVRSVPDTACVTHTFFNWGEFFRGLPDNAENTAETRHEAEYYRHNADTVQAAGAVLRGLTMFIRIISKVFFRDYLLGRFLIAKENLILKSVVCREIKLDSPIS